MQNPMSYIFGAGTDAPTYEALQKRRKIADMLAQRALDTSPKGVGEGIAQLGQALASRYLDRKLEGQEGQERERVAAELARLQSGLPEQGIPQSAYEQLGEMRENPYMSPGDEGVARSLMRRQVVPGFGEGDIPQDIIDRHTDGAPQQMAGDPAAMIEAARKARATWGQNPSPATETDLHGTMQRAIEAPTPDPRLRMQQRQMDHWTDEPQNWENPMLLSGGGGSDTLMGGGKKDKAEEGSARGEVKLTEGQSKDLNFWNRMSATTGEIDAYTPDLTAAGERFKDAIPLVGNMMVSDRYQVGRRAADEWITALLRKDTGAAVTPEEWRMYGPIYIPQPGDGEPVLKAKAEARQRAAEGMKAGLGTAEVLAQELLAARQSAAPPAASGGDDWRSKDPSTWTDEQLQEYLK